MVSFSEGESRGRRFRLSYLAYARARETRARTQCRQSHARCPLTLPLALPLSHPMVCFAQILKSPDTRPGLTLLKKILTKKTTIQDNKNPSIKQNEEDRNNNSASKRKQ